MQGAEATDIRARTGVAGGAVGAGDDSSPLRGRVADEQRKVDQAAAGERSPDRAGALCGRDHEVDAALAVVERAPDSGLEFVWISGDPGIGKSRLLAEICARVADNGRDVVRGAATPFEQTRAFAPLLEALDCRRRGDDTRRTRIAHLAQSVVADLDPFRVTLEPVGVDGAREAIISLLDDLAEVSPLVVALDDVHWADHATITTLHVVATRLARRPITFVVTSRHDAARSDLDTFRANPAAPLTTIELGPLAPVDIDTLLRDVLGAAPNETTRRHFDGAGGHPFLCVALARGLRHEDAIHLDDAGQAALRHPTLPSSLRETVLRRMATMAPELTDVLRYAAVLGPVFDAHDLSVVLGASATQLARPLRQAIDAGMLAEQGARLAFRHALVRDVVYDDLPPALRRTLHRDIAVSLQGAGASADLVAAHARLGATPSDDVAAEMMTAGAGAIIPHDAASAIELLETAVATATAQSTAWSGAITDLVVALQWAGRVDDAEAWCHKGLELARAPLTRVALMVRLGWCRGMRSDYEGATQAIETACRVADVPASVQAVLQSEIATLAAWTFRTDLAESSAAAALELGDPTGVAEATVQARCIQSFLAMLRGDIGDAVSFARDATRRAIPLGDALIPSPHIYLGLALVFADEHEAARATIGEGRRRAREASDLWLSSRYDALEMFAALLAGRFDDALATADALVRVAESTGIRSGFPQAPAVAGIVSLQRGDVDAARHWLALALENQSGAGSEPVGLVFMWWLESALAAHDDDVTRAGHVLTTARQFFTAVAPVVDFLLGLDLVRYALASGDTGRPDAVAVADALDALAPRMSTPTAAAIAAVVRGIVDRNAEVLAGTLKLLRRSPSPILAGRAAEDAGRALMALGHVDEAPAFFGEAHARARVLGAAPDVIRLAHLRDRADPGSGSDTSEATPAPKLTRAERNVLSLVGEGLGNAQIAEHLAISKRTVESHLAKLYAKLGVQGRVALGNEARELGRDE